MGHQKTAQITIDADEARQILEPFGRTWPDFSMTPPHYKVMRPASGVVFSDGYAWASDCRAAARVLCDAPPPEKQDGLWIERLRALDHWGGFETHQNWLPLPISMTVEVTYESCPEGCFVPSDGMACDCDVCNGNGNVFCGHAHIDGRKVRLPFIVSCLELDGAEYAAMPGALPTTPLLVRVRRLGFEAVILGVDPTLKISAGSGREGGRG